MKLFYPPSGAVYPVAKIDKLGKRNFNYFEVIAGSSVEDCVYSSEDEAKTAWNALEAAMREEWGERGKVVPTNKVGLFGKPRTPEPTIDEKA